MRVRRLPPPFSNTEAATFAAGWLEAVCAKTNAFVAAIPEAVAE